MYFADGAVNMYQMRQWYKPLAELAKTWPVVVLSRVATGARALLAEDAPPVAFVPTVRDLERFIAEQDIRVVLYVNQNTRNFQMFRYGRRWHVFINHGESDKMYMTTNQYKAYDYAFIAGRAARERLSPGAVGLRPRPPHDRDRPPAGRPLLRGAAVHARRADRRALRADVGGRSAVGALRLDRQRTARRSSHALLATGRHRVIYRPHPRSGVVNPEYGAANRRIIAALAAANAADPGAHHVFDDGPELGWQLAAADVAIVDISAMVYDRLAADRPLMITRPATPRPLIDTHGYLVGLRVARCGGCRGAIVAETDRVLGDEDAVARLEQWVAHYFGDTAPGAATARFHAAVGAADGVVGRRGTRAPSQTTRTRTRPTRPSSTTDACSRQRRGGLLDESGDRAQRDRHPGRPVARLVDGLVDRLVELERRQERAFDVELRAGRAGVALDERRGGR